MLRRCYGPIIAVLALCLLTACQAAPPPSASGGQAKPAAPAGEKPAAAAESDTDLVKAVKQRGVLRVGWAEFAPYLQRDPKTGTVGGANIDMLQDLADKLGVKLDTVEDSWTTITLGLSSGKYDVTLIAVTPERREQVDFAHPLFQAEYTLVVPKSSSYQSFGDVDQAGNKIAVTTGSSTDQALTKATKQAEIVRIRDVGGALLQLSNGSVNAMATTRDYLVKRMNEVPNGRLLDDHFGVAAWSIAVSKNQAGFVDLANEWAESMKSSGKVADILKKYGLEGVVVSPAGDLKGE